TVSPGPALPDGPRCPGASYNARRSRQTRPTEQPGPGCSLTTTTSATSRTWTALYEVVRAESQLLPRAAGRRVTIPLASMGHERAVALSGLALTATRRSPRGAPSTVPRRQDARLRIGIRDQDPGIRTRNQDPGIRTPESRPRNDIVG